MATQRGCFGVVRSGPSSGAAGAVGEVRNWSFEETADREDVSAMGTCAKKFSSGSKATTGTIEAWYDQDDTRQLDFRVGTEIALELYPGGTASGKKYYAGLANVDSVSLEADVDSSVRVRFGFSVNGELSRLTA